MRIYKLVCICTFIILLSGCNAFSSKTEEPFSKVTSEVVKKEPVVLDITQKETEEEPIRGFHPIVIDAEIMSPIGESQSSFTHSGDVPLKISLSNTGTESFLYKIRNVDKEKNVANGALKVKKVLNRYLTDYPKEIMLYIALEKRKSLQ